MKMIKLTEKSVNKMYDIAEQISEAMDQFMECLDKLEMGNGDEDWDDGEDYEEEDPSDMESGNRSHRQGYRSGMGNRGSGSGYRRSMGNRGEIADRRGVKGTGKYSRY